MDRRIFLSGALAASALSLATAGDSAAQADALADKSAPEYMDLRRYHLANGQGVKLTTAFFANALHSGTEPARHWTSRSVLCLFRTR